jgi:transposase
VAQWQQALRAIIEQYRVQGLLTLHYQVSTQARQVRQYGNRPARSWLEHQIQVSAFINERAVANSCRYFGWRVYATNASEAKLSLAQAVLAYRDQFTQERSFGRLKNKPLSLSPMFLHRDDHATGLVRLLSIALRVLTLLEFSVRRQLNQQHSPLSGLYPGNPKRTTSKPTAERLLRAFDNLTLTIIVQDSQTSTYITPLSPLQLRILSLLDFSPDIYTRFYSIFLNPP